MGGGSERTNRQLGNPRKSMKELLECIEGTEGRYGYYVEYFDMQI